MKKYLKYLFFLIPLLGIVYSLFLIISGFINNFKTKIFVGLLGIILNIVLIYFLGNLMYFSEAAIRSRSHSAKYSMKKLENFLDLYKIKYKCYPDSLKQLNEFSMPFWCVDPFATKIFMKDFSGSYFNYLKKDTSYILFSVGRDRIPNTKDDIYLDKNFIASPISDE